MNLTSDERLLMERASATDGRVRLRDVPLRELLDAAHLGLELQSRGLVILAVDYQLQVLVTVSIELTQSGIRCLAQDRANPLATMLRSTLMGRLSSQERSEVNAAVRRADDENEQLRTENEELTEQVNALQWQLDIATNFVDSAGVLWRRSPSALDNDRYCPSCKILLVVNDYAELACSGCGFRAAFRPSQTATFKPKAV